MQQSKNRRLNKKFVQSQNYNQNNSSISGEEGHFINGRRRLIFDRNKPNLRASGLSLLPLALRPGLLMVGSIALVGAIVGGSLVSSNLVSAASISLSVPNTLSLNINSASPSGTFSNSDKAEISTKTDSKNGYTLSIKAKEDVDSNCLKNGDKKLESILSSISESEYESSGQMNTWAYQPEMFNGSSNSNFLPGPTSSETVLDKTKVGNDLVHNYGIVLAAKINTDLPAGTYKNTYVLTATSNALTYSVHYNLNDGQGGPSPNPQTGQLDGDTFKLDSTVPTKDGLEFKGWCTEQTSDDSCSGGIFQPGSNYRIYCDDNDIELYAMWRSANPTNYGNVGNLQNFNCSEFVSIGDTGDATDSRDNNTYTIAKLADGKCWMTENLKIQDKDLTSDDSDVASNFNLPASVDRPNPSNVFDQSFVHVDETYGGYYTWFAATAGEGTQDKSSGNVSHSICPKGWRLPSSAEYKVITEVYSIDDNAAGSTKLQSNPLNFKLGGLYSSGSFTNGGTDGWYWSSTASQTRTHARLILLNSTRAYPSGDGTKSLLVSVRCISRE